MPVAARTSEVGGVGLGVGLGDGLGVGLGVGGVGLGVGSGVGLGVGSGHSGQPEHTQPLRIGIWSIWKQMASTPQLSMLSAHER